MLRQAIPLLKQAGKQVVKTRLSVVASGILGKLRMRRGPARPNPAAAHPAQGRCHCRPATHPAARPAAAPVAARGRVAT